MGMLSVRCRKKTSPGKALSTFIDGEQRILRVKKNHRVYVPLTAVYRFARLILFAYTPGALFGSIASPFLGQGVVTWRRASGF